VNYFQPHDFLQNVQFIPLEYQFYFNVLLHPTPGNSMKYKWIFYRFQPVLILLLFLMFGVSQSQNEHAISRLIGLIELDGLSDEAAWQEIKPLPLIMQEPNFGAEPTEKTELRIGYNDEYLYVSARCFDSEPSKIQSPSKKRDELSLTNDWFGIILDTFNDNENALAFFTTPSGLRLDMNVFDDAQGEFPINVNWNTFWDVKTVKTDQGWFVEMRIPFSSLRFQEKNGKVIMGLISWRWISRKYEVHIFPSIPSNWGFWSKFKSSLAQEIVFEGLESKKPLYIVPYLLGGYGQNYELNEDETAYDRDDDPETEIGLDLKYGLTSNLTLDLSLNTDFAQVEADNQQINLTRFSLFFPEKRLFFQERAANFEFNFGGPNQLFYSRRIGIYEKSRIPIYGGGRIVGRAGPWDVGILSMQTATRDSIQSENFSVLRLRRQTINPNTYIGCILTNRIDIDGKYNSAYGLDGIFRIFGDEYFTFKWAQTVETGGENDPVSFDPTRLRFNWERRTLKGLGYQINFSRAGKNYNPGLGFEQRENYSRYDGKLLYGWVPNKESKLLRHQIYMDGFIVQNNEDGSTESSQIGPEWDFTSKGGYNGSFEIKYFFENVTDTFSFSDDAEVLPGAYTFYGITAQLSTPFTGLVNIESELNIGSFYDGQRFSLSFNPYWSATSYLILSGYYEYNRLIFSDRNQELGAHIARLRALLMLSTKVSISAFIQYNSARDIVVTNIRFRYNPREGNDLYLVYDEGLNTDRYREQPILPIRNNRTIILKYSYTFNL